MVYPSNNLLGLPGELFETVAQYLADEHISWLRLTCKRLQEMVHHRFRPRFNDRQTDLSTNSLQRLVDISSDPDLGSAIRRLTIIAVTFDKKYLADLVQRETLQHGFIVERDLTEEEIAQAKWEHSVLIQRQSEQASNEDPDLDVMMMTIIFSQLVTLENLTLETAVYKMAAKRLQVYTCTNDLQPWRRALYVYELVMSALAQSDLRMRELNLYGGHWGGSVPIANITGSFDNLTKGNGLQETFKGLTRLSICISPQPLPLSTSTENIRGNISQEDYAGTARLLQLCPDLVRLELHVFQLHQPLMDSDHLLEHISASAQLPRLSRCTLRGMKLREDTLLRFLPAFPSIQNLDLRNIVLEDGSWRKIFDYISSEESAVGDLSVQSLAEARRLQFSDLGPNELFSLHAKELKDGIAYTHFPAHGLAERQLTYPLKLEYGPITGVHGRMQFEGIGGGW